MWTREDLTGKERPQQSNDGIVREAVADGSRKRNMRAPSWEGTVPGVVRQRGAASASAAASAVETPMPKRTLGSP